MLIRLHDVKVRDRYVLLIRSSWPELWRKVFLFLHRWSCHLSEVDDLDVSIAWNSLKKAADIF